MAFQGRQGIVQIGFFVRHSHGFTSVFLSQLVHDTLVFLVRDVEGALERFENRVFVSRDDFVFHGGFHSGSIRVIVF